jgi:hypothetical protein
MKPVIGSSVALLMAKMPFDLGRVTARVDGRGGTELLTLRMTPKDEEAKGHKWGIPVSELERAQAASTLTAFIDNLEREHPLPFKYPETGQRTLPGTLAKFFGGILVGCPDDVSWVTLRLDNYPNESIGVRVVCGERYEEDWLAAVHVTGYDINDVDHYGMQWVQSILQKMELKK